MKKISKETIKTFLSIMGLMIILIIPYLLTKKDKNFNPYTFKMTSASGPITLNELKEKKITLMYFGFLSCPDVCPTTLSSMSSVFKTLSPEKLDKISFVFVDLDPERDTLEKLVKYSKFFHPKIIPVSLNLHDLDLFTRFFGIAFMKMPLKSTMGYTIDHSTDIIVLSPEGKILEQIAHQTPQVVITNRLNQLINDYKL